MTRPLQICFSSAPTGCRIFQLIGHRQGALTNMTTHYAIMLHAYECLWMPMVIGQEVNIQVPGVWSIAVRHMTFCLMKNVIAITLSINLWRQDGFIWGQETRETRSECRGCWLPWLPWLPWLRSHGARPWRIQRVPWPESWRRTAPFAREMPPGRRLTWSDVRSRMGNICYANYEDVWIDDNWCMKLYECIVQKL